MGITIHYEARLGEPAAYEAFIRTARAFAKEREWLARNLQLDVVDHCRVIDDELVTYTGPLHGIELITHEDCEPLRFLFDPDGRAQGFVKTQFAPSAVHIEIVRLLRQLAPLCAKLRVIDEGEYWETGDRARLEARLGVLREAIEELRDNPDKLRELLDLAGEPPPEPDERTS